MARIHTLGATNRRRSRRDGLRALVIVTMCGCLLLGLAACTLVGNSATTSARVLNSDAPVPSGSGLYSLQRATDNRVGQFTLVRLDAVTGKPQWQQALPGNDLDPLIGVSDGIFYAVNGLDVLAFSGRDGSSIWHTTLNPSVHAQSKNSDVPGGRHHLALAVADGHIYIRIGGGLESLPEQVVAVRASDGAQLWSHTFDEFAEVAGGGDGLVIVNVGRNRIQALHAADGALAWQAQYQEVAGEAQMLGGLVYVDEGHTGLVALDENTGALVWTLPCWKHSAIAPSPSGAQIYIECLEPNNDSGASEGVFAFDTQQHQVLWKYHAFNFNAAPVAAANLVFIPHGTVLDAVRASDGKRVWSLQAEEPNAGPVELALIGDTPYVRMSVVFPHVYLGCGTSCERSYSLSALRPSDGAVYWRHYEPSGTQSLLAA
jgi:outer membrane protein assembly factor BamB